MSDDAGPLSIDNESSHMYIHVLMCNHRNMNHLKFKLVILCSNDVACLFSLAMQHRV